MNKKNRIILAFIVFLILFIMYNRRDSNGRLTIFKSYTELFIDEFAPIEMYHTKYLGEIADSSNHMSPYMNFGKYCLPVIDQWENKIEVGDYVSKKKDSLTLFIEGKKGNYYLHFDSKNFKGSPIPCKCSKLNK